MKTYNVAVVGVGAVGIEMLRTLKNRNFPVGELKVLARSERDISVDGKPYHVSTVTPESFKGIDIALFAGTEGEKGAAVTFAPQAVKNGAVVIDNGADFRMRPDVPLVIPEVNPEDANPVRDFFLSRHREGISNGAKKHKGIIANPNCSTIQMVVALSPIYKLSKITRVIVSTYQAASGAGRSAADELVQQLKDITSGKQAAAPKVLPQRIAFNVFPHIGSFAEENYTSEEWKMVKETHKIMHDDNIKISATCARVPVITGHSEAVYIETEKPIKVEKIREVLEKAKGIKVLDDPLKNIYPNAFESEGKYDVFVGRIRRDPFVKNGYWLWVVSDNLLKGAALNAVQIAELLIA
ncbi:MAG: aspartate-semialdehyde dehydrogenase [Candidatus Omnitrophica bacterium CG07_land_8_20_14_0_80_42_15]|uniref:Aspartate-semialdehyde dehydrogenase n=1 Tax=Candidatus Aquitaenariimonas noxiae TaxID=1974741 RepID=A0A2J0L1J3_9BACT|nr:MAG: aspartate-semialdehyde dehydrogenase [Candidatus Omnitrophica bacterium CG07_land_8_20_14_0_80_42_15]